MKSSTSHNALFRYLKLYCKWKTRREWMRQEGKGGTKGRVLEGRVGETPGQRYRNRRKRRITQSRSLVLWPSVSSSQSRLCSMICYQGIVTGQPLQTTWYFELSFDISSFPSSVAFFLLFQSVFSFVFHSCCIWSLFPISSLHEQHVLSQFFSCSFNRFSLSIGFSFILHSCRVYSLFPVSCLHKPS